MDSEGFTELTLNGSRAYEQWPPHEYAFWVRVYYEEIGNLAWAAIQDWMCEDAMLAKTGLSVRQHQALTIRSYLDLMALDPDLPWCPVLQGSTQTTINATPKTTSPMASTSLPFQS